MLPTSYGANAALSLLSATASERERVPFTLSALSFSKHAFGALIAEEMFNFQHGKHHNGYMRKTN
jgi:hypothetical protein